jgi:hypothetical protein
MRDDDDRRTTATTVSTIFRTDSHVRSLPVQGIDLSLCVGTFRPTGLDASYYKTATAAFTTVFHWYTYLSLLGIRLCVGIVLQFCTGQ